MKPPFLGAEQELVFGTKSVIESNSSDGTRGVVFEDDGETGYFYARDFKAAMHYFVDALHIYDVKSCPDSNAPCQIKIIWTRDYHAAALMINLVPQAVFDFEKRCGYSMSPFPEPDASTGWIHSNELPQTRELFFQPNSA